MDLRTETIPFIEWPDFFENYFQWNQGEHVGLIGPTGSGKTVLEKAILAKRDYVVVFATKRTDSSLNALQKAGYKRIKEWQPDNKTNKYLLWPPIKKMSDVAIQQKVFFNAFMEIFTSGRWCIVLDELPYFISTLKLETQVKLFWQQGRSLKSSLVAATQRPAFVPLEIYDQSSHLFFWKDNDENNLKRISGIGSLSAKLVRATVAALEPHEVLYINTRSDVMLRTKVTFERK